MSTHTSLSDTPAGDPKAFNLWSEVTNAREVLDGLMRLWRQNELTIDDARRLSVLVFNGGRTVAILLAHQTRMNSHSPEIQEWLDEALKQLGEGLDIEL
jgi:hypothetical protein